MGVNFGASGSGSSSTSESSGSSRPPRTTFLNPASAVLANLFGIPTSLYEGGITYGTPRRSDPLQLASPVFGPNTGFEEVGNFINLQNPAQSYLNPLMSESVRGAGLGLNIFDEYALPTLEELLSTGAPVNVDPLVERTMSDVAETLAPRTGFYSSDLAAEALRQGSELRVGAEEAAAGRRADTLAVAPLLLQSRAGLPASLASELLGLGEEISMSTTPAGRSVALLQLMAGLQPTGAISRGNISQSQSESKGQSVATGSESGAHIW